MYTRLSRDVNGRRVDQEDQWLILRCWILYRLKQRAGARTDLGKELVDKPRVHIKLVASIRPPLTITIGGFHFFLIRFESIDKQPNTYL